MAFGNFQRKRFVKIAIDDRIGRFHGLGMRRFYPFRLRRAFAFVNGYVTSAGFTRGLCGKLQTFVETFDPVLARSAIGE